MTETQFMLWILSILVAALIGLVVTRKEHERRHKIATRRAKLCDHSYGYKYAYMGWPCPGCMVDGKYGIGRYAKYYPKCEKCGHKHDAEAVCTFAIANERNTPKLGDW